MINAFAPVFFADIQYLWLVPIIISQTEMFCEKLALFVEAIGKSTLN